MLWCCGFYFIFFVSNIPFLQEKIIEKTLPKLIYLCSTFLKLEFAKLKYQVNKFKVHLS